MMHTSLLHLSEITLYCDDFFKENTKLYFTGTRQYPCTPLLRPIHSSGKFKSPAVLNTERAAIEQNYKQKGIRLSHCLRLSAIQKQARLWAMADPLVRCQFVSRLSISVFKKILNKAQLLIQRFLLRLGGPSCHQKCGYSIKSPPDRVYPRDTRVSHSVITNSSMTAD